MGLVGRNMAVLLGGAAMTVLLATQAGWTQDAEQADQTILVDGESAAEAGQDQATQQAAPPMAGATQLDRITIVSRTGETAIEQMASVSHVDRKQLERRMAASPSDLLFGVPGVALQSDANRTSSSVSIRGLQDFGRVAVILDGARQDFQRSGHGTQSSFWIDPELIQRIDVIRGPVANTYGSGAIGGVVMIDSKDADDFLRDGETWAASATAGYETNGRGWTTSGTGAYRFSDSFDVLGNIVWRDYDNYKDGNGDIQDWTSFEILSGMLKTTIRPTELSELKLGWIGAHDEWTVNANDEDVPVPSDLETNQNTFTARYNIKDENESWLDLHVNAAYNNTDMVQTYLEDVPDRYTPGGIPTVYPAGSQSTFDVRTPSLDIWNTSRFDTGFVSHEVAYGGDWVQDDVDTTSPLGGEDIYTPSGKRRVSGAYIQEKLVWEWLEVVGALRYDSYKLSSDVGEAEGDRLSPRITVGVSPFEQLGLEGLDGLQLYGTYAEGYRSPSLSETLISGMHPAGIRFPFLPNPNLKPETAHTVEFGMNYSRDGLFQADDSLRLKAAYFNNDIDDYIGGQTLMAVGPGADPNCPFVPGPGAIPTCFQYQNFAKGKIDGFELESFYDAQWMFAGLSVSIIDGHTINDDGIRESMVGVAPYQATATLGFRTMEDRLVFGAEVQYNASATYDVLNERGVMMPYDVDDYTMVNLFASYQANENLRVNFRVDNLLDTTYENYLNAASLENFYEPGITAKLGATMRFGG